MTRDGLVEIAFLIGATEYRLEESDARWLERAIRATCIDVSGRAWDPEARAALQIADVIAEDLSRGPAPEPIELDRTGAYGLVHSFHDKAVPDVQAHVATSEGVAAFYLALRRFVREAA